MKKSILAVAGVAAFAGVAMPFGGAFATDANSLTDTVKVTIADNCALSYGSTNHVDGEEVGEGTAKHNIATWGTGDTANTLTGAMTNSSFTTNYGKTNFSVTCNDTGGSYVKLTAGTLATGTTGDYDSISLSTTEPSATTIQSGSSWAILSSSTSARVASGNNVWASANASGVSAETFNVTYQIGIDATQAAGTYTGTAQYTLSHPKV